MAMRHLPRFLFRSLMGTVVLVALSTGIALLRDGRFAKMLEEDLMILGCLTAAIGVTMLFASNGPLGQPQETDRSHSPAGGLVLLASGIVAVCLSVWVFDHPMLFR